MLPSLQLRDDVSYLIIGGLKGLCGSVALMFARYGAKSVIVMGRSGFEDPTSKTTIQNIEAEGCKIFLVKGDVIKKEDVQKAFACAEKVRAADGCSSGSVLIFLNSPSVESSRGQWL